MFAGRLHWHAFVIFKQPVRRFTCKKLILDNGAHCNPLLRDDTSYLDDGHDTVAGPRTFEEKPTQGKRSDIKSFKEAIDRGDSIREISNSHFGCWCKYGNLITRYRMLQTDTQSAYPLSSFKWAPLDLEHQHAHLFGPPDTGKTQFALAHFERPLYVRHPDHLTHFDPKHHDGIVVDELSFTHWPICSVINMLNKKDPAMIHIRYQVAYLPAGVRIIFCSNEPDIFYDPSKPVPGYASESIIAKCTSYHVLEKLY